MIYKVPFLTSNEDELTVNKIFVKNGQFVKKHQILFDVETTKTSIQIESEFQGYINFNFNENSKLVCGTEFYEVLKEKKIEITRPKNETQEKIITNEAKIIIQDYKINLKRPRNRDSKEFIRIKRLLSSTTKIK